MREVGDLSVGPLGLPEGSGDIRRDRMDRVFCFQLAGATSPCLLLVLSLPSSLLTALHTLCRP